MPTMHNDDVSQVAKEVFAHGFFLRSDARPEHTAETPVRLALALLGSGVTYGQLNALALAVREIGGLEALAPDEPVSGKQLDRWEKLLAEKALPSPFRALLEAATPKLKLRKDIYALYGVLSGTMERLAAIGGLAELAVKG